MHFSRSPALRAQTDRPRRLRPTRPPARRGLAPPLLVRAAPTVPAAAAVLLVPQSGGEAPDVVSHPSRRGRHGADANVEPEVGDNDSGLPL